MIYFNAIFNCIALSLLQVSEKSSIKSYEGFAPLVLKLLQEISLAHLMAQYACKVLRGNDPSDARIAAREDVMSAKWVSSRDVNVKIYMVMPHPLHVEVSYVERCV